MSPSTLRIAWRNLGRSRRRTALAVLAVAVGQFALLASAGLMHGYADNIRNAVTGPMIGHVQVHAPQWRQEHSLDLQLPQTARLAAACARDPAVAGVAPRLYAPVLAAPSRDAGAAVVLGVDLAAESTPEGLLAGTAAQLGPKEVLVGERLARRLHVEPGQELAIVGQAPDGAIANDLYRVRALIRSPADLVNQSGIVMALAEAQELFGMPGAAHELVIRARPGADDAALAARLAALPELQGLDVQGWRSLVPELVVLLRLTDYVSYIVLALVFVAAIAGIANTLIMSTFERTHELGMLLALGSTPGRIVRMVIGEALCLGLLGALLGSLLGGGFVWHYGGPGIDLSTWGDAHARDLAFGGLNLQLLIHPRLEALDVGVGLAAIVLTSLAASCWPAWLASHLEPVAAMRQ